ncbi:GNAT family N-acetyltransferase [Pedobacter sp. AW1-32]|uniref:GNAT family N-acetyltransferase n=1 Tax=Pedobacter sp. AW1-32 TaxID=3383026 RepID=UPI003FEF89CA
MQHILDNPIYNALRSNHQHISSGTTEVKVYDEEITAFAGFNEYSSENYDQLHKISSGKNVHVVFTLESVKEMKNWEIVHTIDMFQMVYNQQTVSKNENNNFVELDNQHIPQMNELVELTKPGPFLSRTIELGNYIGFFNDRQLISMLGQRLNPYSFVEISAVCTHPNHLGNGYARVLLNEQIRRITENNQVPFLHVKNDNQAAIKLYEKVGFNVRTEMIATVLKKK